MNRSLLLLVACFVALLVFGISVLPTETKHAMHIQGVLHPWLHLLGFALLAALLLAAFRSVPLRVLLLVALLLFGYATEARESREDGGPIETKDVRTDALGTLLGAACAVVLTRIRSSSRSS